MGLLLILYVAYNIFHNSNEEYDPGYNVDSVVNNFSNLQIDPPPRYTTSPWRYGHENLWRNGRPQSCFPFQFPYGPNHFNGFHDHYPESQGNFYNEPTFRYERRNHHGGHGPWTRNNYWMNNMSSQIDNYVQYSRRFHN